MMLRQQRSRCGYTLIEVIIVVTIVAIAAAIIVPQMLKAGTMTAQAAGRTIIADLLWAQNDAVAAQRPRRVAFDTVNESYQILQETDSGWESIQASWRTGRSDCDKYQVNFAADQRYDAVQIVSVDFAGESHIEYDDLGAPSTGGNVVIEANGTSYRIDVAPMTGRVTISKVTGE